MPAPCDKVLVPFCSTSRLTAPCSSLGTYSTLRDSPQEFSHWKVNSLATEKRGFFKVPLAPEFLRNLRLLGRRPSLQQVHENLIKKYGTHFLVSATLGGEESLTIFLDKQKLGKKSEGSGNSSAVSLEILHQLAASYFTDREGTLRRLHHLQIATSAIKEITWNMQIMDMWMSQPGTAGGSVVVRLV
ncbi:hypothetical protein P4O66_002971 [Electrophorus voltai]|uniref:MACPF domain-containing protein n=1 Tax=Electrophorus voltai TaxID=2609070 RepID=A0AAD8YSV1_9TELE|nr:hypothetical protein P4O66_002971 [Electrophorus voltai]